MKKVTLGRTGLKVSRVGMGGIPITRPQEDEAIKIIQRAHNLGINFFDTATGYGRGSSEKRIGAALKDHRDNVIIATKTASMDENGASRDLKRSLRQLDTNYIDLWQLGNVTTYTKYKRMQQFDGALKSAEKALREGKVRHIGMSTHNLTIAIEAVSSGMFETIQFPFNLIADEAAHELIPLAKERDVGFIASKSFAAGNIEDANLAIKFLLQFDNVVPDPGIQSINELEEIINIVNGELGLTVQEKQALEEIHDKMYSRFCRHCEECMPCPKSVHIPQLLYITSAYKLRSSESFKKGGGPDLKSWDKCDLCGDCEERCPFNLPIREMLKENVEFYHSV